MTENENGPLQTVNWAGMDEELGSYIAEESKKTLGAYGEQSHLVHEHANLEEDTTRGGYADRQLFELVQNSADALAGKSGGGRIEIRLTEAYLYCADDGEPIDEAGVTALMFSHMSPKRETSQIGRFGLGFKSVLGVTDAPEFFSRSGSFRFDRGRTRERIRQVVPDAKRCPVLRLADPIDPVENCEKDDVLHQLMNWATNIVRLRLKTSAHGHLSEQMSDFPPEFLLFVEHVRQLKLKDDGPWDILDRTLELKNVGGEYHLTDGSATSKWRLFEHRHELSSDAQDDQRPLDDGDEVPIWWAAPLDQLKETGKFWAFSPTKTTSLVSGILNAPWKTNEDKQNLLRGTYNDELIKAAAVMIAKALPELTTKMDPARHFDALPRRRETGDSEQANLLRKHLFSNLFGREIIPDQNGKLRATRDISYPPKELTPDRGMDMSPFQRWEAYLDRPSAWLHHSAIRRDRFATVDRLFHSEGEPPSPAIDGAPRATIEKWLKSLVRKQNPERKIEASKAAIQTAALISPEIRKKQQRLGSIVRTASDEWREPDPEHLFLPEESANDHHSLEPLESRVHWRLVADTDTLAALKKLGIKPPSHESIFRLIAKKVLNSNEGPSANPWAEFWEQARNVGDAAHDIICEHGNWKLKLHVRTRSGDWRPRHAVLLPGEIVPTDGSRDENATVEMDFHKPDVELLRSLGVTDAPHEKYDLWPELQRGNFQSECRNEFLQKKVSRTRPRRELLNFESTIGSGPIRVLAALSDEGKELYTDALLSLDATYEKWVMRHDSQATYGKLRFDSPALQFLREHGRVQTPGGIVPLADALGPEPKNPAALHTLLNHPKADKIKEAFNLAEPTPEFIGEEYPIPLLDIWPGLEEHFDLEHWQWKTYQLIRCEKILVGGKESERFFQAPNIYVARTDDERKELRLVCDDLKLHEYQLDKILQYKTKIEIEERRAEIKKCSTDAERLLKAVGEQNLRRGLPNSLLAIIESDNGTLTGVDIAEAAIATYHSDALRQYRWALDRLNPPKKWAGLKPAIDFVLSLGFSAEWAGERNRRRDPFLEIEGPYSLPPLHGYQRNIVDKVRSMFRNARVNGNERRGMISMPTGSGKTRVAVQAIVEAMRDDAFKGGILWVADRDELCEQAVEAWRQAWSSIGANGSFLRISRMWAGQSRPLPTNDLHIVVATIQTLNARLLNQAAEYDFLTDFNLVVFDEAHRSIAPIFTSVMQDIGLTRRQEANEPFLLGLTATPYRGYNEEETAWLARRYGSNRLDAGAFESDDPQDVIGELQNMHVLARADHETIEGGEFVLNEDELQEMQRVPWWLPQSVEARIAEDAERTKRIIEAYDTHIGRDWPTLIFATSVEHAKTVAALLNARGIKSRAVSGETESSTRRRVVKEFRSGGIKALVNYGVFREGFDAPKTRAIIVARPVYSPNLYFQMIGRGLRGIKNGGNDRCLILNVRDNIRNFGKVLAFSELDWLWD